MNNKKKMVGLSLALTLAFSSVMLMKTLLFGPRRTAEVKTGNAGGAQAPSEEKDSAEKAVVKTAPAAVPQQEKAGEEPAVPADPVKEETEGKGQPAGVPGKLDINAAGADELEALPGIGEYLAEAVIACRDEMGGFRTVEDIMETPGIGPAKFRAIADLITVGEIK